MAQANPTTSTLESSFIPFTDCKVNERGITRKEFTFKVDAVGGALLTFHLSTVTMLVPTIMVPCLDDGEISLQNGVSESVFALVQSVYRYSSQ